MMQGNQSNKTHINGEKVLKKLFYVLTNSKVRKDKTAVLYENPNYYFEVKTQIARATSYFTYYR